MIKAFKYLSWVSIAFALEEISSFLGGFSFFKFFMGYFKLYSYQGPVVKIFSFLLIMSLTLFCLSGTFLYKDKRLKVIFLLFTAFYFLLDFVIFLKLISPGAD